MPPDGESRYADVVVSYSRADSGWVTAELVPQLRTNGISHFVDNQDLHPGEDWRARIADAILHCKHLLLVLTPSWVSSDECRFEASGAFMLDPWGMKGKIVPIELIECLNVAPDWVKRKNAPSFKTPDARLQSWPALIQSLKAAPRRILPTWSLDEIFQGSAKALQLLGKSLGQAESLRTDIRDIIYWKEFHDCFHELEPRWPTLRAAYDSVLENPADLASWKSLRLELRNSLKPVVARILKQSRSVPGAPVEDWVVDIQQGTQQLSDILEGFIRSEGVNPVDAETLDMAFEGVRSIVHGQPSDLNRRIVTVTERLPVEGLASVLERIRSEIQAATSDVSNRRVQALDEFLADLRDLRLSIDMHVTCHNRLQRIQDEVANLDPSHWKSVGDFRRDWGRARLHLLPLASSPFDSVAWACELVEQGRDIARRLQEPTVRLDAAKEEFDVFRSHALQIFRDVDRDLRNFCADHLKPLGDRLEAFLTKATETGSPS